jgi:hypothetical protein
MKRGPGVALLVCVGLLAAGLAAAGEPAKPGARQPVGTIQLATKSIAMGVGVTWGDGTLTFAGADHRFTVEGLSLTDLGIGNATVKGNVYNLSRLEDFAGAYKVVEPDFALGGAGPPWSNAYRGLIVGNDKGVVVQAWIAREGPLLRLADHAVTVTLR